MPHVLFIFRFLHSMINLSEIVREGLERKRKNHLVIGKSLVWERYGKVDQLGEEFYYGKLEENKNYRKLKIQVTHNNLNGKKVLLI